MTSAADVQDWLEQCLKVTWGTQFDDKTKTKDKEPSNQEFCPQSRRKQVVLIEIHGVIHEGRILSIFWFNLNKVN